MCCEKSGLIVSKGNLVHPIALVNDDKRIMEISTADDESDSADKSPHTDETVEMAGTTRPSTSMTLE